MRTEHEQGAREDGEARASEACEPGEPLTDPSVNFSLQIAGFAATADG